MDLTITGEPYQAWMVVLAVPKVRLLTETLCQRKNFAVLNNHHLPTCGIPFILRHKNLSGSLQAQYALMSNAEMFC